MFRVATITAVVVAVLAAATAAGAATRLFAANCSCASFWAKGSGYVSQTGGGAVWGSISGNGALWIRDNESEHHYTVSHYSGRSWVASASAWKYTGRNMTFQAWGNWWVKAQGSGIAESATAQGSASLKGTGRYSLNGGRTSNWPSSAPRRIQLRG